MILSGSLTLVDLILEEAVYDIHFVSQTFNNADELYPFLTGIEKRCLYEEISKCLITTKLSFFTHMKKDNYPRSVDQSLLVLKNFLNQTSVNGMGKMSGFGHLSFHLDEKKLADFQSSQQKYSMAESIPPTTYTQLLDKELKQIELYDRNKALFIKDDIEKVIF